MKEFLQAISNRVRSPVFGHFLLAFIAINWKCILFVITSNEIPLVRIKYVEENISLATTLWYPIAFAIFMGLVYPWINLAFLKVGSLPTRIRNNIHAQTEHSLLLKKLQYEKARSALNDIQERQLIDKSKRDEEVKNISDPKLRENLKMQIAELRQKRYQDKEIGLHEAASIALDVIGIEAAKVSTTGGNTGVRVWLSKDVSENTLKHLHEEIVSLHGQPVALNVRDFMSDRIIFTSNRPDFLK